MIAETGGMRPARRRERLIAAVTRDSQTAREGMRMLSKREVEEIAERAEKRLTAMPERQLALCASLREAMEALEDTDNCGSNNCTAKHLLSLWNQVASEEGAG